MMKINKVQVISFIFSLCTSVDLISVMGFRLTLIPLIIYGIFILINKRTIDKNIWYVLFFFLLCTPSLFYTYDIGKSVGYLFWIIFNFIFISCVFKSLAQEDYYQTLQGVMNSYRVQIVIGAILYILHIQERAHVLYYEPSYFAISLIPYVVLVLASLLKQNHSLPTPAARPLDLFLCLVAIVTTKSANLILIFLIGFLILSLYGRRKLLKVAVTLVFASIAFMCLYFYAKENNDLIAITFKNIFMSDNVTQALIERAGNRWYRVEMAYDVALQHFWGVGIGAYTEFTLNNKSSYPYYSSLPWYLNPFGLPAISLYIEMAATCGWLALIVWLAWHYKMLFSKHVSSAKGSVIFFSLIISMLILIIESSFMRPYYWALIGICLAHSDKKILSSTYQK
ncbi:TPA: O-antigen ligase family protein [Klebsiella pneumoniae]|uniref:O-antigen ligase family protein n=1 Tax=Klebsiella pneumoniae TaxID=573 RepID=UPI000E34A5AA|nr:O-antigen ligase family protein [Klebsiella pneumoniae]MEC4451707.1 O-antigen ligase family protein [Klebsiella pneumoniae]QJN34046.1 O-antigen ligase family protein [Klebsiella pneumoniae]QJN64959.1 O-antigen ligase family protein [Klebsiella pneumoniae]HDH0891141.1 O-antigen ligase family protein [Klebsiella pneumoniae]HDK5754280.1 O-antigen ligase family protein [Klebsiella pneumoniae]